MTYTITENGPTDEIPFNLLLLADPNLQLIEAYLPTSLIYFLRIHQQIIGVCVLQVKERTGEIMNIVIAPEYQGQGLGKALLIHMVEVAKQRKLEQLVIKTGNSSIAQLALYQRIGFNLIQVNFDHFLEKYTLPIWENGIQCRHQMVLALVV